MSCSIYRVVLTSWPEPHPQLHHYQALDDLQQFFHHHSNPLVPKEPADCLEMRRSHKVPVGAIDVAVGDVEWLWGWAKTKPLLDLQNILNSYTNCLKLADH